MSVDRLEEDLAELRSGAALLEHEGELLELAGADRLRLLNGLVTADVKGASPGSAIRGFFTSAQGRVLADFLLLAGAERSWLHLPRGTGSEIRRHLEKYRVAARVEIRELEGASLFELRGAGAEARLDPTLRDATFRGQNGSRFGLLAGGESEEEAISVATLQRAGFARLSEEALEIARVEEGELRFGVDFSAENFPQETGREGEVSYTKGCYLGQEVVARIHYRGGVQRLPRGLRFAAEPPPVGTELVFEGRPAGRVTSVARSPRFGGIGLAIVHQRAAAAGTRLEFDLTGRAFEALVAELPFGAGEGRETA